MVGLGLLPRDEILAAVESIGAAALRGGPRRRRCALALRRDAEADNMLKTYTSHNNNDSITRFSLKLHRSVRLLLLAHVPGTQVQVKKVSNGDALASLLSHSPPSWLWRPSRPICVQGTVHMGPKSHSC